MADTDNERPPMTPTQEVAESVQEEICKARRALRRAQEILEERKPAKKGKSVDPRPLEFRVAAVLVAGAITASDDAAAELQKLSGVDVF